MAEEKSDIDKKVDESWKESVGKEKAPENAASGQKGVEVTFDLFISGLMMEALVGLGEIENPIKKKKELNLPHAQFVIDTLTILQEKTKNNLTKEESEMLEAILYDLRMRFIQRTKSEGKAA